MDATGSVTVNLDLLGASSTTLPAANVDLISVRGLQLPRGVLGPDIWGQTKEQPAFVDVDLQLNEGFQSASSQDTVDASTVHYGILSKGIREEAKDAVLVTDTMERLTERIWKTAATVDHTTNPVSSLRLTMTLPKASSYGSGFKLIQHTTPTSHMPYIVCLDRLKVMTLIGVNAVERTGKQALVVTCTIFSAEIRTSRWHRDVDTILKYERDLVGAIEKTSFQTLEALAEHLYTVIVTDLEALKLAGVRLKIEKPGAVIHAEAPAIELVRRVHQ